VVGCKTASLTPDPSFAHNLGCRCPNDSCEAILDIYTSRTFQRYKEHINARCFDPCNRLLNFRESRRTPNSHFRECEWRPHIPFKVGLRKLELGMPYAYLNVATDKVYAHSNDKTWLYEQPQFTEPLLAKHVNL
jgi:hypothetical protein